MTQEQKIKHFAGIYKMTPHRGIVPNAHVNNCGSGLLVYGANPTASFPGWMTMQFPQYFGDSIPGFAEMGSGDGEATWSDLRSISINCTESDEIIQFDGSHGVNGTHIFPNDEHGGCSRLFGSAKIGTRPDGEMQGSFYASSNFTSGKGGTILITPVDPDYSGDSWARYEYRTGGLCIDCCYTKIQGETEFTNLKFIEGSGGPEDAFRLKSSIWSANHYDSLVTDVYEMPWQAIDWDGIWPPAETTDKCATCTVNWALCSPANLTDAYGCDEMCSNPWGPCPTCMSDSCCNNGGPCAGHASLDWMKCQQGSLCDGYPSYSPYLPYAYKCETNRDSYERPHYYYVWFEEAWNAELNPGLKGTTTLPSEGVRAVKLPKKKTRADIWKERKDSWEN